jgi:hypothetical protein
MKSGVSVISTSQLTIRVLQYHLEPLHLRPVLSLCEGRRVHSRAHDLQHIVTQPGSSQLSSWRSERWLRRVRDGVVNLISPVAHVPENSVRLLDEVDLETDMVDYIRPVPGNWHDSDEVDERDPSSTIIDQ